MINCNEYCILKGPEDESRVPQESVGKIIFDCLRKRDSQRLIHIDAVTGHTLTNGKLLKNSLKATTVFKNLGVKNGDVISIISENSLNYCVPILAALYMGVTVNLVNPHYVYGELKHALTVCKPKIILCSKLALENVLKVRGDIIYTKQLILTGPSCTHHKIEGLEDLLHKTPSNEVNFQPESLNCAEHVAFIVLSSGTTGLPKGVLVTHQNFRHFICQMIHPQYGNFTSQDTLLLILPFFHLFGLGALMSAIFASANSVLLNKFQPNEFLRSIQEHKVTKLVIVPPLLLFLAKNPLVNTYDLSSLKDITVGAACIGTQLQEEVTQRLYGAAIRQAYGLTEAGGSCTYQRIGDNKARGIGNLAPDMTAKVWDCNLKKNLGPMEVGELCFKGPVIMKGYLGNPVATQECIDEDGFLHSGDLGYYDQDGYFYIVGRIKEIIKYKAFQVPPAELEALMLTHPGIKDCGVIGVPHERAGEVPLAYVVLQPGANITEQEIVSFVAERISVEKHLYGGVVFIEEIPKSASGKILRGKLKEIFEKSLQKS